MGCIIVMMPRREDSIRLKNIIRQSGLWEDVVVSGRASETLEIASDRDVSAVVCTENACGMSHEDLCADLPPGIRALVLTRDSALMPVPDREMKLLMPFRPDDLIASLRTLISGPGNSRRSQKKPSPRSPEERKVIDDAKAVLMDRNGMSEPEAFRYIQKVSMDASRTMVETAQMILYLNGG